MVIVFAWDTLINNPFDLYGLWSDLDIPMHFLGGVVTAWSFTRLFAILPKNWRPVIRPVGAQLIFSIGLVGLITIGWEVYELIFDWIHPFPSPMTLIDSLGDMLNGLVGATVFWLVKRYVHGARATTKISHRNKAGQRKKTDNQTV